MLKFISTQLFRLIPIYLMAFLCALFQWMVPGKLHLNQNNAISVGKG